VNDTMSKFEQAAHTVNAWVFVGKGQAGFEWQHGILVKFKDTQDAKALAEWWSTHPANPANA
jgi:hypothetical protein